MRYAPLSKPRSITNPKTVLPTLTVQDLYKRFDKKKRIVPTPNKVVDFPANQNIAFDCQKPRFKCSNSFVKTPSSAAARSDTQTSTTQPLGHMKPTKHGVRIGICVDNVRKHTMSSVNLVAAVKTHARFCTFGFLVEKDMNILTKHMRCSNKI